MSAKKDNSGLTALCDLFEKEKFKGFKVRKNMPLPHNQRFKVPLLVTSPKGEFIFPIVCRDNPISLKDKDLLDQCQRVYSAYEATKKGAVQVLVVAPLVPGERPVIREYVRRSFSDYHKIEDYLGNIRKF